jgi:hypothetical protein
MEALLQLEKVQRVLSLMGARGLSDPTADGGGGDRFLAHFLLFLVWFSSAVSRIQSPRCAGYARACLSRDYG